MQQDCVDANIPSCQSSLYRAYGLPVANHPVENAARCEKGGGGQAGAAGGADGGGGAVGVAQLPYGLNGRTHEW